jgi:hypothetical protein
VRRDWLAEAHLIARAAPGFGNPLDLTVAEFDAHLRYAVDGYAQDRSSSRGGDWMRAYVEANR